MSGMVGTPEAYALCARCRHARIRHTEHGAGPCASIVPAPAPSPTGANCANFAPCACPGFVTPTEGAH